MDRIGSIFKHLPGLRHYLHPKSMLLKMILSYIIIGSVLIALLSTWLFIRFSDKSIEDINSVSVNNMEQSVKTFNSLWNITYMSMNKEFRNNGILMDALHLTRFTALEYGDISKELNKIVSNNAYVYSAYAYNEAADAVFSSFGPMTSLQDFYDRDIIERLQKADLKVSSVSDSTIIFRRVHFKYNTTIHDKIVISIIFTDNSFQGALVFNIDQNMLKNMITPENNNGMNLQVINEDGMVISDADTDVILTNISDKEYVRKILDGSSRNGFFIGEVDGRKSLVTYSRWDKWNSLKWIMISTGEYDQLLWKVRQLQKSILLTSLGFILISILIALFFAGNIYAPVYRLMGKVKPDREEGSLKRRNELEVLFNAYDSMEQDINKLKTYKNSSRQVLKNELLERMLEGEDANAGELRKLAEELSLKLHSEHYLVLILRLDNYRVLLEENTPEELSLLRFAVGNIAGELLADRFEVEIADSMEDHVCVIINADSPLVSTAAVKAAAKELQEACTKYLELSLTVGIGSRQEGTGAIHVSYINAMEASNYRVIYGRGSVIAYEETAAAGQVAYEYPFVLEKGIMEAVKAAEREKVAGFLDRFIEAISRFTYHEMLLALNQLTILSFRMVEQLLNGDSLGGTGVVPDYRLAGTVFKNSESLGEIREWLWGYYRKAMDSLEKKRETRYGDILETIQRYIDTNYADPNLSVEAAASLVGLSPNYTRMLFKEKHGISISNYINDIRFGNAMRLLVTTEEPANRIAEAVGFPAGGYFYTAFKKVTGMTPDEYRKTAGNGLERNI